MPKGKGTLKEEVERLVQGAVEDTTQKKASLRRLFELAQEHGFDQVTGVLAEMMDSTDDSAVGAMLHHFLTSLGEAASEAA